MGTNVPAVENDMKNDERNIFQFLGIISTNFKSYLSSFLDLRSENN